MRPNTPQLPLIAKHHGTCPACGRYIVPGKSKIIPVPRGTFRPRRPKYYSRYEAETGNYLDHDGRVIPPRPVPSWMHAGCETRLRGSKAGKYTLGLSLQSEGDRWA